MAERSSWDAGILKVNARIQRRWRRAQGVGYRARELGNADFFLLGFGCEKEDYADIMRYPALDGCPFLACDALGGGETACSDLARISIPFLVEIALTMLEPAGIDHVYLVGHSMGGLIAPELAHVQPDRGLSFTDIEGNISPEYCGLRRQIVEAVNFIQFVEPVQLCRLGISLRRDLRQLRVLTTTSVCSRTFFPVPLPRQSLEKEAGFQ